MQHSNTSSAGDDARPPTSHLPTCRDLVIDRVADVVARSGQARSTLYLRIDQKLWPQPFRLGVKAVGWFRHEVDAILVAYASGMADSEIRKLVIKIEAERHVLGQSLG